MKKLFLLIALTGMFATGCENFLEEDYTDVNKIWYTTTDGKIAEPFPPVYEGHFGANIISNTYGSQGVIRFDDEVTTIGGGAFYKCGNLKSIILPNSVASIGRVAFSECGSLESITIPNAVTSIGEMAFKFCKSLNSITIPDGVTKIDSETFLECSSLESVSLGSGVTRICYHAFAGCSSLKSVYCKATTPPTGDSEMFSYYSNGDMPIGCKIYVPRNSVESYKSAEYWRQYADNIVGYDF